MDREKLVTKLETLKKQHAQIVQQIGQLRANLDAHAGAIALAEELLAEAPAPRDFPRPVEVEGDARTGSD